MTTFVKYVLFGFGSSLFSIFRRLKCFSYQIVKLSISIFSPTSPDEEISRLNSLSRDTRLLPRDMRHVQPRDAHYVQPRDQRFLSRDLLTCDPRDRTHSDGAMMKQGTSLPRNQLSSSQLTGLTSPPDYNGKYIYVKILISDRN